jgi:hypothetical protein
MLFIYLMSMTCLAKDATEYDESRTVIGEMPISRSPQVHPGDAKLVTAVRHAELNHLIFLQVVYFSIKNGDQTNPLYLEEHDLCSHA